MLPKPLPQQTSSASQGAFERSNSNPGLLFDRYAPREIGGNVKAKFLDDICRSAERVDEDLLMATVDRWKALVAQFNGKVLEMETDWRFLTGIGINNRTEVGFLFNRYGFPYLPGSGCKGVARAHALSKAPVLREKSILQNLSLADLDKRLSAEDGPYKTIFGNQETAGSVIFFSGIPASKPRLEVDVLTPHFGDYYTGTMVPSDSLPPSPHQFLAVAPGQKFLFAVGWRNTTSVDTTLLTAAHNWLREGLEWVGAGAKTSAGYGYFRGYPGGSQKN